MPFAPAANPDLAGEFMFRGISQAGQALGRGIDQAIDTFTTASKERKAYLGLADVMAKSGQITDVERAAMDNWDTDRIKGYVDGKKVAATLQHLQQQGRLQDAQARLYTQQADTARDELTNAALQPEFFAGMERYMSGQVPQSYDEAVRGVSSVAPLPPMQAMARAARETGYHVRPNQLDDILRAAALGGPVGTPTVQPSGTPGVVIFTDQNGKSHALNVPVQKPVTGEASVRPSPVPGIAIATDPTGKTTFVRTGAADDLSVAGKSQADQLRLEIANTDAEIGATQARIRKEPNATQRVRKGGTQISTDYFGTEDVPLKDYLDRLLQQRTRAATELQSLRDTARQAPAAQAAPSKPQAPVQWRFNVQTGQLEPIP